MAGKKKCFVISPIGKPGEDTRRFANWFLNGIVRPALEDLFEVRRGDEDRESEIITTKVIERIREADLIVADLSGSNPNVFYELGVAHSFERRVIQMIRGNPADVPFDVNPVRTIGYSVHEFDDLGLYQKELREAAEATMKAEKVRNPVTAAQGVANLSTGADSEKELIETLAEQVAELRSIVLRPVGGLIPPSYQEYIATDGTPRARIDSSDIAGAPVRYFLEKSRRSQLAAIEPTARQEIVEDIVAQVLATRATRGAWVTHKRLDAIADDVIKRYWEGRASGRK
jgi:hypothetical protein